VVENIRTTQDHIRFLENFINEITGKIDELTNGRDIEKEILSLEYRLEVLRNSNGTFTERIAELEKELKEARSEFGKIKPVIESLEEERAYYRKVQSDLSSI
jgi:chromosome segregation ATPase